MTTSETFSHMEERHQRRKRRSPSPRGLGHDAMSRALDQLSKSPFTRRIEGAALPRRFQQPIFIIYNGNTDPVEHVSQFNQKMAVHSKNESADVQGFPIQPRTSDDEVIQRSKSGLCRFI